MHVATAADPKDFWDVQPSPVLGSASAFEFPSAQDKALVIKARAATLCEFATELHRDKLGQRHIDSDATASKTPAAFVDSEEAREFAATQAEQIVRQEDSRLLRLHGIEDDLPLELVPEALAALSPLVAWTALHLQINKMHRAVIHLSRLSHLVHAFPVPSDRLAEVRAIEIDAIKACPSPEVIERTFFECLFTAIAAALQVTFENASLPNWW
jgi:hypothetical protein